MMKRSFFALALMLTLLLCACTAAPTVRETAPTQDDTPLIGLSMDSFVIERWQRDRDVFVARAKELGMDVLVQDAGGVSEEQIEHIRYFIRKGVRAIVVVAVDCSGLSDVIGEAKAAGIPVISYDRLILDAPVDLYISFDNEQVGRLMARNLVENLSAGGRIVCINGSETDNNVSELFGGFQDEIAKSTLTIVHTSYCHNWTAQAAYDEIQHLVNDGVAFEGLMCGNDDLASMAYKALSERAMMDSVVMVGQDADLAACQRIVSGWQSMTVHKQVASLARCAAESVADIIEGKTVAATRSMNNGYTDVPSILLEPVAVTRDNIDSVIIASGFHTREDVYANVRAD